jgi:phenylalanyl-tRNA synthetase beta chain
MPIVAFAFAAEPTGEPEWRDSHFLRLKSDAEALLHALTGRRDFEFVQDKRNGLHPGKTAAILLDGREIAFMGQTDPRVTNAFDVRRPVYGCAIYLERVPEYAPPRFVSPSKYPSTYRDLAVVCDVDVPAATVEIVVREAIGALCTGVRAFDEYRGSQIPHDKKSLALRATIQRSDATITDEEADALVARAVEALRERLNATLRS